jgi:hypothetical protein
MDPESLLIKQIEKMLGYVPSGTRDLLHILAHPDVLKLTQSYLKSKDE